MLDRPLIDDSANVTPAAFIFRPQISINVQTVLPSARDCDDRDIGSEILKLPIIFRSVAAHVVYGREG